MRVFWTFLSRNLILGVTYQKVIESRYIGNFLIICQIIDIIIHFLKLLVTLRNYRQNYRYQKLKENYRKIIVFKKFGLTPTPSLNQPCLAFLGLRTTLFEFHEHWSKIWRMSRIQSIRKGQFALKTLPKAQRTRVLSSYHKFKHKSRQNSRILTKHQLQNLNKTPASP